MSEHGTPSRPSAATPFAGLSPDVLMQAAESLGLEPDGRLFALNSYENRVYRLGRIDAAPVVVKFYREARWSDAQILEEHAFALELAEQEIPVAPPLLLAGATLHRFDGFRLAVFPLCAGAAPELDAEGARALLGRTLARVHAVGALRRFQQRLSLERAQLGERSRRVLLRSELLPEHMQQRYEAVSAELVDKIADALAQSAPASIRLHGDCHLGNILWQQRGPLLVDLDDCLNGPRIQDLWMFLSGSANDQRHQWSEIIEGYEQFGALDHGELRLIEPLRAARMLNHAAWIAERWRDPAFPRAFPWAGQARYWEGYVGDLMQQCEVLDDPPRL
ncbi:MAG: serine/threonine protein kinase [Steroidobacteraceae bacterium]